MTSYDEIEKISVKEIFKRVEKDRKYAGQLLEFVNNVNLKKAHDPALWKMSKAYLAFITKDNQNCLQQISKLEKSIPKKDSLYFNQIKIIKALALTANQQAGKAIIENDVKQVLINNTNHKKFLFAIGRELEYKGNRIDAAFLYSKLNERADNGYDSSNYAYWKSSKGKIGYYTDYYSDYFDYINVFYSPEEVQKLISESTKTDAIDKFSVWKHSTVKNETKELEDLIGVKYIRQNKLEQALSYFSKNEYRSDREINYSDCMWERENCDYRLKDPFFVLKYTPEFVLQKKILRFNKYTVTQKLISYNAYQTSLLFSHPFHSFLLVIN